MVNGFLSFCATVGTGIVTLFGYIIPLTGVVIIVACIVSIASAPTYH